MVGAKKKSPQWMLRRFVTGPIAGPEFCSCAAAIRPLRSLEHIMAQFVNNKAMEEGRIAGDVIDSRHAILP